MTYVQINSVSYGSTGEIMLKKHKELLASGEVSYACWGIGRPADSSIGEFKYGFKGSSRVDKLLTYFDGRAGFHSIIPTMRLLKFLDTVKPDVVHLHNLHGWHLNVELLFRWLLTHDCEVRWTLHDCWAMTGHCAYFTFVKCAQWKTHCAYSEKCPQLNTYPETRSAKSCSWNFENKRRVFTELPTDRMTLITPSNWLAELVGESFLSKYPVEVLHNTIDKTVFSPTPSDFRRRYGIGGRFMILGVASPWSERKGLPDFVRLARELDSKRFAIVLVGLDEHQIGKLSTLLAASPKSVAADKNTEVYALANEFAHPKFGKTYRPAAADAQSCENKSTVAEGGVCAKIVEPSSSVTVTPMFNDLRPHLVNLAGGGQTVLFKKTDNPLQLAGIYSAANVLFNPTLEDNYPTVNLEAESCGTAVITYDSGGCRETVTRADSCVVSSFDSAVVKMRDLAEREKVRA